MISEPEAAAVYALDVLDPHQIKVGDTFVVCDAGGGTVDLISYTVMALKPRLEVVEATPGTGSLSGSTFLNRRFEKFLEGKLGQEPGGTKISSMTLEASFNLPLGSRLTIKQAMRRFETVVRSGS